MLGGRAGHGVRDLQRDPLVVLVGRRRGWHDAEVRVVDPRDVAGRDVAEPRGQGRPDVARGDRHAAGARLAVRTAADGTVGRGDLAHHRDVGIGGRGSGRRGLRAEDGEVRVEEGDVDLVAREDRVVRTGRPDVADLQDELGARRGADDDLARGEEVGVVTGQPPVAAVVVGPRPSRWRRRRTPRRRSTTASPSVAPRPLSTIVTGQFVPEIGPISQLSGPLVRTPTIGDIVNPASARAGSPSADVRPVACAGNDATAARTRATTTGTATNRAFESFFTLVLPSAAPCRGACSDTVHPGCYTFASPRLAGPATPGTRPDQGVPHVLGWEKAANGSRRAWWYASGAEAAVDAHLGAGDVRRCI